ncbi:hypothetical protein NFI96_009419 [Prochilodus magdalenae]|nr:hypothetical protein NFI96_009419 [Prochilodus magdalenae]
MEECLSGLRDETVYSVTHNRYYKIFCVVFCGPRLVRRKDETEAMMLVMAVYCFSVVWMQKKNKQSFVDNVHSESFSMHAGCELEHLHTNMHAGYSALLLSVRKPRVHGTHVRSLHQKFSDDSAVVGCISWGDEDEYRATVNDFVAWCELNHLQLNVTKTKKLVVDLRRDKAQVTPISIKGVSVDTVEDYKYLGVHIDNKLDWAKNTDALYRKGQSRLYFLRRLRSFNICKTMLRIFYESVVASAILYAVACWGSRLRVADANRLNKLIRKARDVVGVELDSLMAVSERRTLSKLQTIMDNGSHPLYHTVMRHRSAFSARLIQPKCTTERHRRLVAMMHKCILKSHNTDEDK